MGRIGVLALQGDFAEHIAVLEGLGVEALPIRLPQGLEGLDGLIIPGGESTTISRLMVEYGIREKVKSLIAEGLSVFGTCAGMILLAKKASRLDVEPLSAMDIDVRRNSFGRQVDSFETELSLPILGEKPFPAVFIRAPRMERVGEGVQVLARLSDGTPVAVREGNLLSCAFHPELTTDTRFHEYFLNIVSDYRRERQCLR